MKNYLIEMIRRVIQIVVGTFVFDCPGLLRLRGLCYKVLLNGTGKNVISSKVLFYVPHGLVKQYTKIGKKVRISENVRIDCSGSVTIEDNVWISENVIILNHNHIINGKELKETKNVEVTEGIVIEEDAWIGANALILPQVKKIGRGAVVGAGSVVTRDVEEYTIVAGNPAEVIGNRE